MSAEPAVTAAMPEADDEVLMARFTAGEVAAFETLYDRYETAVFGFCLRLLGDRHSAEDAFQETMIAVVERAPVYRERGRFRGWLFAIARNACLDRARRSVRRHALLSATRGRGAGAGVRDPESTLLVRDEIARLLSQLPADQREILLLHRYEGFSYQEIAGITGSTEAAVKQKAHRALRQLRATRHDSK